MKLPILSRYILREWTLAFAGITVVLFLVVLAVFFGDILGDVADGEIPAGLLFGQLGLRAPEALNLILPLSVMLAVMVGLGRLYRDQEMVVMQSGGFSRRQLLTPLAVLLIPVALVLLIFSLYLNPLAQQNAEQQLREAYESAAVWGLKPGRFQVLNGGDLVVYAAEVNDEGADISQLFVYQRAEEFDEIWTAADGRYWFDEEADARYLSLRDGFKVDVVPGQLDLRMLQYAENDLKLPPPESRQEAEEDQLSRLPTSELLQRDTPQASGELHWRLAPALAALVLGVLAIPLSHSAPRENPFGRILLGLLTFAVYSNLLSVGRVWISDDGIPGGLGLWWLHASVLIFAAYWLRQQQRANL